VDLANDHGIGDEAREPVVGYQLCEGDASRVDVEAVRVKPAGDLRCPRYGDRDAVLRSQPWTACLIVRHSVRMRCTRCSVNSGLADTVAIFCSASVAEPSARGTYGVAP
jgi:hypothetical protein